MSKAYSMIIIIPLVLQFGCRAGQVVYRTQTDQQRLAATGWPDQIAGRSLSGITDEYALYANNEASAEELKRWLEIELEEFRSDEADDCTKPGVVLAIEPDEEPVLVVEQWRKENVNRARLIAWTSSIRNQSFNSPDGRPYCLSKRPYFRESFSMSYQEALRLGFLDIQDPRPAWICFLATDRHLNMAFDEQRERQRQQYGESLKEVPVLVRMLSFPSELIFSAAALFVIPKYRSIDSELMHLQRRETLNHALIRCCCEDKTLRSQRLESLRDEIDRAWKYIWVRRPID